MIINSDTAAQSGWEKVVIHMESEVIKGFLESQPMETLDALLLGATMGMPPFLRIRRLGGEVVEEIPTESAKALFYVRTFDGDAAHKDVQFYKRAPLMHGLWIRIEFLDGEVMEGLVDNTTDFIVGRGFFIRPTDPGGNNRLAYVLKRALKGCHVLGLRNIQDPRTSPDLR